MSDLPVISGSDAIRVFSLFGFVQVRQNGSHCILKKPDHRFLVSVPLHSTLKAGTLRGCIRSAGLTVEEFVAGKNL